MIPNFGNIFYPEKHLERKENKLEYCDILSMKCLFGLDRKIISRKQNFLLRVNRTANVFPSVESPYPKLLLMEHAISHTVAPIKFFLKMSYCSNILSLSFSLCKIHPTYLIRK